MWRIEKEDDERENLRAFFLRHPLLSLLIDYNQISCIPS
uniref:Uncharacterized protein n=1 Tax=uncultured organism TaxID=155900 RepID=A0A447I5F7_9ZZZZ|nr:hypothetical protein [uncultured organism]